MQRSSVSALSLTGGDDPLAARRYSVAMPRYVVRSSTGNLSPEQVAKLKASPKVAVVDESPKMLLVDAGEKELEEAVASFGDITVHEEMTYSVPDPHPNVQKPEMPPAKPKRK